MLWSYAITWRTENCCGPQFGSEPFEPDVASQKHTKELHFCINKERERKNNLVQSNHLTLSRGYVDATSFTSKQKQQRVGSRLTPVRRKRRADGTSLKLLKRTVQASGSAEQILGQPIVVDEEVPMISRYAILRKSCMRSKRFFWTCESDRKLLMAYIRVRAVLGARYYRVPWKSLSDLPAPPHTCLRRIALLLKTNGKIKGAVMCLCNLLGEWYVRDLEKERSLKRRRLFPQISNRSQENSLDSDCEQFNWDDFEVPEIKSALNEVFELIETENIDQAKRIGPVNQKNINNDNDVTKDTICSQ
ncbi:B-block binding subunit of TFIIIC [Zea mays]|uniref:B-block binding subunit of TFIIIC n=1 Tax=Zea mays TaxID=4577 RepID=A0A1D6KUJ6_MAIZE|nr:B-block binding subunit of TFIIIC [Zea mays]